MTLNELRQKFERGEISKAAFINRTGEVHAKLFDLARSLGQQIESIRLEKDRVVYSLAGEGVVLALTQFDKRVAPIEAMNFGSYEPSIWRVMHACCLAIARPADIIDVGANIGWYTLRLAKAFPDLRIVALEPVAATYAQLAENVALNHLTNVIMLPLALAEAPGEGHIVDAIGSSVSTHLVTSISGGGKPRDGLEKVTISSLDLLCVGGAIEPVFIKADIEGAELPMLRGASVTLGRYRPIVLCELLRKWSARFGYHPNEAINFLASFGYECWAITPQGISGINHMTDETQETNFLFTIPGKHQPVIDKIHKAA